MFGADTSTSNRATLGGMIGNNSSGTNSLRFGTTVDHVRALNVVLSDGTAAELGPSERGADLRGGHRVRQIRDGLETIAEQYRTAIEDRFPRYWRHSGGYRLPDLGRPSAGEVDLARFVVGSEGTLAVITEAEVDLVERPRAEAMAVGHFSTVRDALAATADALDGSAVAVELMDRTILDLARQRHEYAGLSGLVHGSPGALLFVTFMAETESEAVAQMETLASVWRSHGHGYHTFRAHTPELRAAVMKVRKASLGLLMAASTGTRRPLAFVEDTAVPPEVLERYVARFGEILDDHGLEAGYYGHCAVGCLHIRPFVDVREPAQEEAMAAVAAAVLELVVEFGGVNSSEHGDGLVRSPFNERFFGAELYAAMRDVKNVWDPARLLNPGKIVDPTAMTQNLRDRDLPQGQAPQTMLDFGPGGMRATADRCMNIGVCRKRDAGVMCPSYMATGREEDSTRGRANALVRAMSGGDDLQRLGDHRLHEILDLCLECKACASECPLSVDMATLKSEFLHHYHAIHGTPLRSRLFGAARTVGRVGSATAPLSNVAAGAAPVRWALERLLGITSQRPLPRYERQSLPRWSAHRTSKGSTSPDLREVVFLADSFTSFCEPRIGRAAIELLEGAGWRVHVETKGCCGRASLSKGLLRDARRHAESLVRRLHPFASRGVPVVGCEPSCVFTVRDDFPRLLSHSSAARVVASQVRSFPELLMEAIRADELSLGTRSSACTILYQPHCHERAAGGATATQELLRCIPGAAVTQLDAGCCGMAGSFGFEAEHYRLSMEVGELKLFPRLREANPDALVAATGISCRQQIAHGTGRTALHPIELIRSLALLP
jgi:Fe-S oxidoreductase/FAD/FMN-containing dehydrogenase